MSLGLITQRAKKHQAKHDRDEKASKIAAKSQQEVHVRENDSFNHPRFNTGPDITLESEMDFPAFQNLSLKEGDQSPLLSPGQSNANKPWGAWGSNTSLAEGLPVPTNIKSFAGVTRRPEKGEEVAGIPLTFLEEPIEVASHGKRGKKIILLQMNNNGRRRN